MEQVKTDTLPPIIRKGMENGLITVSAVSENKRPETSVLESVNWDFDTIGSATIRKGLTRIGNQLGGNILGLYYFVDTVNVSPKTQLITVNGGNVYYLSGGIWSTIRSSLTTAKARFTTFLNYVFMVNGNEATAIWDGTVGGNFVTTGNALSAPVGKYIENYRSRVWIAGNASYPDRVYYSSVPTLVATPLIAWNTDVATGQWLDVSPSDGDTITGLQRTRSSMLVFKTNHIYRIFDIGQTDPDPIYAVGTSSMESVLETYAGVFFHHSSGFYLYNTSGILQLISKPIIDIVRAIPTSAYANVVGWIEADGDHINWSIGTITYKGVTYTNAVVRYTISTQTWTHRGYPNQITASIKRQPIYTDGTTPFVIVGDSAGNTAEYNTGMTDLGTPISYSLIHRWDNIDGLLATRKNVQTGVFTHKGGAGSNISYQIEDEIGGEDAENDWTKTFGQLRSYDTGFNTMNIKGRKVRFRISGMSSGQQFTYHGYELLGVVTEFLQFS